jgi:hypothetical protein
LGPPSGANAAIDQVDERSGTFIGGGIALAIKEITKPGSGDTAKRSAIVVLTDGADNTDDELLMTIGNVTDAGKAGIRVHFGFLKDLLTGVEESPDLQSAIKATGGFFSSIDTSNDIEKFVASVLANGLTEQDAKASNGATVLLPSLNASSTLSKSGPATFQYSVQTGEKINVTVSAITSGLGLKETVKDKSGKEVASASSNSSGVAYLEYSATSDTDLSIEVTGTGSVVEGLFSIEVGSSFACGGLTTTNTTNTTTPTNSTGNGTIPTHTPSPTPTVFQGAAATLGMSLGLGVSVFAAAAFALI